MGRRLSYKYMQGPVRCYLKLNASFSYQLESMEYDSSQSNQLWMWRRDFFVFVLCPNAVSNDSIQLIYSRLKSRNNRSYDTDHPWRVISEHIFSWTNIVEMENVNTTCDISVSDSLIDGRLLIIIQSEPPAATCSFLFPACICFFYFRCGAKRKTFFPLINATDSKKETQASKINFS